MLAIANKQNFGYISPADFNLYAKQAQLDIFENYFYRYNEWIAKQNGRVSGSQYADIVKNLEEVIDRFSMEDTLVNNSDNVYNIPNETDNSDTCYLLNKVLVDINILDVVRAAEYKEAERVSHSKITMLNASNLTAPKLETPAYTQSELTIALYPITIENDNQVIAQYIRKPKDPKWTYSSLSGGEPIFDQGAADYQDFELPASDEPTLVAKILKYIGISIREADLYQAGASEEAKEAQKQG